MLSLENISTSIKYLLKDQSTNNATNDYINNNNNNNNNNNTYNYLY